MSFFWKPECVQALQEGLLAGHTYDVITSEINARFNTTYSSKAVENKAHRLAKGGERVEIKWTEETKAKLVEIYNSPESYSFHYITSLLNEACGTTYSRCAVIGQAKRLGLSGKVPAARIRINKPKIKIIDANSNSSQKRVVESVQAAERPALRFVAVPVRNLSILELEDNDCRYPNGGGVQGDPITFCGCPRYSYEGLFGQRRSSYCRPHFELTRELPRVRA